MRCRSPGVADELHRFIDGLDRRKIKRLAAIAAKARLFFVGTVRFDIVRDGVHALDTARRGDGRELFRVAVDVPTEGHDTFVDGDVNMLAAEARINSSSAMSLGGAVNRSSLFLHRKHTVMRLRFREDHFDPNQGQTQRLQVFSTSRRNGYLPSNWSGPIAQSHWSWPSA
jgi:hypothetical protein